jgi:pullulanase/glycogen debranching enzyme
LLIASLQLLNVKTTGLGHIKELGVTHIHLLPSFDFNSVDETKPALITKA